MLKTGLFSDIIYDTLSMNYSTRLKSSDIININKLGLSTFLKLLNFATLYLLTLLQKQIESSKNHTSKIISKTIYLHPQDIKQYFQNLIKNGISF
jgi:hypothetical protein